MPDWYPATEESFHVIQQCKNFLIRLPSENYKVIDLKPHAIISLGKFGSFQSDSLIGKQFGPSWEVLPDKGIKLLEREEQVDDEEDVYIRDNRDVFDDQSAQQLSAEEIKEVRSNMSSKDIISTISSNNVNFTKKSVFSQEKYLRSKEQRFLRAFTPIQPSVGNICEFLWADKRERGMDLSLETIGLLLSLANICAGGRYLVIDESGLLIAAILERGASVFLLHENQEPNLDILKFFPHLQHHFQTDTIPEDGADITFCSMDFLAAFHAGSITLVPPKSSPMYERKLRTYNLAVRVHEIWKNGGFDGFIGVSSYDPTTFLPYCMEKLEMCANIAIYSPFREPIVELQNFILTKMPSRPILAPTIHEIRAEKWNTLKGRVRPDMISRGGGGWLLAGTRVEESDPTENDFNIQNRKRRKVQENGSEMEDVKTDSAIETE